MAQQQGEPGDLSFEQALSALEDVVRRLETGEVPLAESIDLYERGEALRRLCQQRLDAAQERIERIVTGPDGKPSGLAPFDEPDDEAPAAASSSAASSDAATPDTAVTPPARADGR